MNNLPLLSAAPQAAPKASNKPAQPASPTQAISTSSANVGADESSTQAQPFGDVLARQVAEAASPDDAATKKVTDKISTDVDTQLKADELIPVAILADAATNLPNDMLAALLPQSVPQSTDVPLEDAATRAQATPGELVTTTTSKTANLATSNAPLDLTTTQTSSTRPAVNLSSTPQKDAAFTTMLETMTAATATKLAADDQALEALTAPTNTATVVTVQTTTSPLTPANVMPAQVNINTPVNHEDWGDEFGQKITWLASAKEQSAELHLNPPQLGPMDVVLKVSGDQATALFTSPHAAVREAIEQALPKLREMMAENGISLGNATVNDQSPRQRQESENAKSTGNRGGLTGIADSASPTTVRVSTINRHNGIVDTFA